MGRRGHCIQRTVAPAKCDKGARAHPITCPNPTTWDVGGALYTGSSGTPKLVAAAASFRVGIDSEKSRPRVRGGYKVPIGGWALRTNRKLSPSTYEKRKTMQKYANLFFGPGVFSFISVILCFFHTFVEYLLVLRPHSTEDCVVISVCFFLPLGN